MTYITSRWNQHSWAAFLDSHIIDYPSPINLNYNWSFGSTAGICLAIQILSGIFLSIHYTATAEFAFSSIEHIIRDVKAGWFLRYLHANGASFFFITIFAHIARGVYHGSYTKPRETLWISGIVLLFIGIATAFLGYVLPWGQISFWGATVITSIFSAIPYFGNKIVIWLWGGYTVTGVTLKRFYSFHYVLPFLIVGIVFVHLALLHKNGSNNPLGIKTTNIAFYPYIYVKDLVAFFVLIIFLTIFVCFWPNFLGDPTNYIRANFLKTPAHLLPEWYFLPFYAILRVIPHKLGGVLIIIASLLSLLLLPVLHKGWIRSATFRPIYRLWFWLWLGTCLLLGWSGQTPLGGNEGDFYILVGRILTFIYFFLILIGPSLFAWLDKKFLFRKID
jgi:quinol-cytochrome oxidoreductase complex cytochrome b subunit